MPDEPIDPEGIPHGPEPEWKSNPQYRGLIPIMSGDDPRRHKAGRKKGSVSITTLLRRELKRCDPEGKKRAQALVEAMIEKAIEGNSPYMKEIMNRIDGPVESVTKVIGVNSVADAIGAIEAELDGNQPE